MKIEFGGGDNPKRPDFRQVDIRKMNDCLLYTSPSPRDYAASRMPSSA